MNALMPSTASPPRQIKKWCKCLKQDEDLKTKACAFKKEEIAPFRSKAKQKTNKNHLTSHTHRTYQIAKGEKGKGKKTHTGFLDQG